MRPILRKTRAKKLMKEALRTRKIAHEHTIFEKALREGKSPDHKGADSFGRLAKIVREKALEEARQAKRQKPVASVAVQKMKRTAKRISRKL